MVDKNRNNNFIARRSSESYISINFAKPQALALMSFPVIDVIRKVSVTKSYRIIFFYHLPYPDNLFPQLKEKNVWDQVKRGLESSRK